MTDQDAILDHWLATSAFDDDRMIAERVRAGGPDEWHDALTGRSIEDADPLSAWVIRQPQCDRATAIHVWLALGPEYYAGSDWVQPDGKYWDKSVIDLIQEIVERWKSGFYARSEIRWCLDDRNWGLLRTKYGAAKLRIPPDMLEDIDGRTVAGCFWSQFPKEYLESR